MRNIKLIGLLLPAFLLLGCATHYVKMKNYLSSPPYGMSPKEFKDDIGKMPAKIDHFSDVTRMTYKTFRGGNLEDVNFWAYFRDDRLIRISEEDYPFGAFTELNDLVAIGVISKEEYQWRHQQLSQRALSALQIISSMPPPASYQMPAYQVSEPKSKRYNFNLHPNIIGPGHSNQVYQGTIQEKGSSGRYQVDMHPTIVGPGYSTESYSGEIQEVK